MDIESDIQGITDTLIEDLNTLLICRIIFNNDIKRREAQILQKISDIRNLGLEHTDYNPRRDSTGPQQPSSSSSRTVSSEAVLEAVTEPSVNLKKLIAPKRSTVVDKQSVYR